MKEDERKSTNTINELIKKAEMSGRPNYAIAIKKSMPLCEALDGCRGDIALAALLMCAAHVTGESAPEGGPLQGFLQHLEFTMRGLISKLDNAAEMPCTSKVAH